MGRVIVHERAKRPLLYRMYALIHELSGSLRSAQSRVRECTWIAIRAHVSSRLGSLSLAWRQEVLCTHDAKNSFRSAAAVPYELKSTAPSVYYTMSGWSKFCISNLEYARASASSWLEERTWARLTIVHFLFGNWAPYVCSNEWSFLCFYWDLELTTKINIFL